MKSKTDRIKAMLNAGSSAAAIAGKVGVSKSYVYAVKGKMTKAKRIAERIDLAEQRVAAMKEAEATPEPNPLDVQVGGYHYKDMVIQPIQFITANNLGFLEGCIVKRISRWKVKGGVEDLEKIKHEVDLLISLQDQ